MLCKICGTTSNNIFSTTLLNKYEVNYFECPRCKFIQTEEPFWLDEAYNSAINTTDTGLLARNLQFLPLISTLLYFLIGKDQYYVDYGGGYGVFTRLMRDIGFNYHWIDRQCENIHAKGFEWNQSIKPAAITLFETFEHFVDPRMEVKKLLGISKNIIFSTTLAPTVTPHPEKWWYYGLEHGQHTAFYRKETFRYIAREEKVHYTNFGNIHMFTEKVLLKEDALLLKYGARFAFPFIKRFNVSKTFSDMQTIIEMNKQQ